MNTKKKNALTLLGIFTIVLLSTLAFIWQEGNAARLISKQEKIYAQQGAYRNWLDCDGSSVAVRDTPDFRGEDIEAYWSKTSQIVFVVNQDPIYCVSLGFGWTPEGFTYGVDENSGRRVLLFRIRGRSSQRYFNAREQREVYRLPHRSSLVVSDAPALEPGVTMHSMKAWQGAYSSVDKAEYLRITTEVQWHELWQRHDKTGQPAPPVDFRKNMIIAILMGRTTNISRVCIVDLRKIDYVLRFRFAGESYQTVGAVDNVTPFGFFVMPKMNNKIVLQENIQTNPESPAHWKKRAEFDKISD